MKKFIFLGVIIIIVLAGIGAYFFYLSFTSGGVEVEVSAPSDVELGVPFDVSVSVRNDSNSILGETILALNIPSGMILVGGYEGQVVEKREVGDIAPGSLYQEKFRMIAVEASLPAEGDFERAGMTTEISAVVSYLPSSLGARFEREGSVEVSIVNTGPSLTIESPEKVLVGEEFELSISYKNTAEVKFESAEVSLDYPEGFTLIRSEPEPDFQNIWSLGDISRDSEGKIAITGSVVVEGQSAVTLEVNLSALFFGRSHSVQRQIVNIGVSPSPLSLKVLLNDSTSTVVGPGEVLGYKLTYKNSSETTFENIVVTAQLSGSMFDFSTLQADAAYNSFERKLTWSSAQLGDLKRVEPGATGETAFAIRTRPEYPIRRLNDKNFSLMVQGKIESPTVPVSVVASKTVSIDSLETKMKGAIELKAKALFRDAEAGVINQGPLPPKVGVPTDFMIHWTLANFSTDIRDVVVRVQLQDRVTAKSVISATDGELSFDENGGEVVWRLNRISATRGVISPPLEAVFQITLTPSQQYAGSFMTLLGPVSVTALDEFAGVQVSAFYPALTTVLEGDPTVKPTDGIVVQ